jgi:hypothetical protein
VAAGGADGTVTIVVVGSSSGPLAGFSGTLAVGAGVVGATVQWGVQFLGFDGGGFARVRVVDGRLTFGYLSDNGLLSAGQDVLVLRATVCLMEGTRAGEYPLVLDAGELVDFESARAIRPALAGGTLRLLADLEPGAGCPPETLAGGREFLRGDINSDGVVSVADLQAYALFQYGRPQEIPRCIQTTDTDNSADIEFFDFHRLLGFLFHGDSPPAAPFPEPGQDDGNDPYHFFDCDDYGYGAPLDDPAARMEVLDAVAPGGAEALVRITIAVSSSRAVGAYSGAVVSAPGILTGTPLQRGAVLAGDPQSPWNSHSTRAGRLAFGFVSDLEGASVISAGDGVEVIELSACLVPGTPAGEYPLNLDAGELADAETGRAVRPILVSGTMTVLDDVLPGAPCRLVAGTEPVRWRQPLPADINARFELDGVIARPGGTTTMPFRMRADEEIQGFSFSVDFDEEVLEVVNFEWVVPRDEAGQSFSRFHINSANENPGSAGVDEGYIIGAVVFSFRSTDYNLPPHVDHEVLRLGFQVNPATPASVSEVPFVDGAPGAEFTSGPVVNTLVALGTTYTPETASSFVFLSGYVNVLPEISTFIRGDANGDETVDVSDPIATLRWLFTGGERPVCYDAADANDDGRIDLSDPVAALGFLYLGGPRIPPPYPERGEDPSGDRLGCRYVDD